ncbi:DNA replication ATP-dependent helicase/nuclease DNA2 isoform X2 [Halyomorpha halys]|uniref:DNA replication ATP-dependent helicase/nuclease DNA2 isoform X2 n=1 Tax=Halyomorpha halys TaxID=286706 RepID=UPI0006D50739|nr:DNA replication ATP-dependent helicase/nuclease DNA2 [Halyomorpha halys]
MRVLNLFTMKKRQIETNQRTLFNFFSKTSDLQEKKDATSLNRRPIKDCVKDISVNSSDIFNGLNKFRENKPIVRPNNESVLVSTENKDNQDCKTAAAHDLKNSPTKVVQKNISTFLSPSKNTVLKLENNVSSRNGMTGNGSGYVIPSVERKPISLKRSPKKRKFQESPLKNTVLKFFSSPEKSQLPLKNEISACGNCSTESNDETNEKKDDTDSVNLAEDSIIISPQKIKVKRRKCLLEESSSKRTLNFKDVTNDEKSNKAFDDDDDDESAFFKASLFYEENKNFDLKELQRCQVISINDGDNGEKQLTLKNLAKKSTGLCTLRSPWNDCPIFPQDIISVRGVQSPEGWVVDWNGLLVTHPDKLISGTTIVGSVYCMRKTILSHIFKEVGGGTRYPMVLGSSVHQLFQEALKQKYLSIEEIEKEYKRMIDSKDFILNMFLEKIDYAEITNKLYSFIEHIHKFMKRYIAGYSDSDKGNNWSGEIVETQDIEENIYSPVLGVKGKVDATVRVQVGNRVKTMPLELKTGKVSFSIEHRGQVILYCMLLKQMGYLVDSGLLLYLSSGVEMKEIKCEEKEVRDLTLLRNGLCHWLIKSTSVEATDDLTFPSLPPPINRKSCSSCPYLVPCYAALREKNLSELKEGNLLSGFGSAATKHLSDSDIKFVFHWLSLIFLERGSSKSSLSDIWNVNPEIREKTGKCLAQMKVDSCVKADGVQFIATFSKADNSLLETELTTGQLIIISSENHIAQALGKIQEISPMTISVMLDKHINSDKLMTIDLYDSDGTYNILMNNLTILMESTDRSAALRDLIIDLKIPTFSAKLSSKIKRIGEDIFARLNKEQVRAVLQAISAENYILIKGMPGAGKTTTMAALIELLTRLRLKVLVTSFTHSAVDNILINLVGKVKMLRLGPEHRIHPKLKEYTENYYLQSLQEVNTANIEKIFTDKDVVGVTCFGCKHLWVERQLFDVCLVDEAAQVSLPAILKPISLAKKFILVGDPKQLPALVLNEKARELGLGISLFERLDRPAVTSPLTIQYRMNRVINALANNLTYNGQLKCANKETEELTLSLPKGIPSSAPDWLQQALSTDLRRSVVIINIENKNISDSTENQEEAKIVSDIVDALMKGGVEGESIGVIAPYNRQVLLLRSSIEESIEVNTVDQYQGRDKDIIIFSTTRSNYSTGKDILGDWNRMNVAVTRAKRKLIILGNLDILYKYENFAKLLSFVEKDNIFKVV